MKKPAESWRSLAASWVLVKARWLPIALLWCRLAILRAFGLGHRGKGQSDRQASKTLKEERMDAGGIEKQANTPSNGNAESIDDFVLELVRTLLAKKS